MPIKPIILPKKDLEFVKFVQVYYYVNGDRKPVLRYNAAPGGYHSVLLEETLKKLNLKIETISLGDGEFGPKPRAEGIYELCGAGIVESANNFFIFGGKSRAYGTSPNRQHLEELQKLVSGFEFAIN